MQLLKSRTHKTAIMFFTTLPILFNYIQIISYPEFLLLVVGLLSFTFLSTQAPKTGWEEDHSENLYLYLHATWFGRVALWKTFWPFFIVFNATLAYIDYRAITATYTMASWATMHIIFAMPLIYWTVSVWRSSDKCGWKWQAAIARCATLLAHLEYLIRYLIWYEFPSTLFNCRQMILQFGDCFF